MYTHLKNHTVHDRWSLPHTIPFRSTPKCTTATSSYSIQSPKSRPPRRQTYRGQT
ncbi:hypothetical protein BDQ17DRAFT_1382876, partial [Cyathus striatus]